MTRPAGEALREAGNGAKKNQAQRKMLDRLFKKFVGDSEMTAEQLAQIQPTLKQQFMEREARRAA